MHVMNADLVCVCVCARQKGHRRRRRRYRPGERWWRRYKRKKCHFYCSDGNSKLYISIWYDNNILRTNDDCAENGKATLTFAQPMPSQMMTMSSASSFFSLLLLSSPYSFLLFTIEWLPVELEVERISSSAIPSELRFSLECVFLWVFFSDKKNHTMIITSSCG